MTDTSPAASLRIAEFAITNFRTFQERTVIPLGTAEHADPVVVFHGDNGAGKSSALAALDLFFRAFTLWLRRRASSIGAIDPTMRFEWGDAQALKELPLRYRDWPAGVRQPMTLEVRFVSLGTYRVQLTPSGSDVFLSAQQAAGPASLTAMVQEDYVPLLIPWCKSLRSVIETPLGPGSRPFFILDDHRRGSWRTDEAYREESLATLSPLLAEKLLQLRLSLEPHERERWRSFGALLSRFSTLKGKEISVDRVTRDSAPELFFEERGRQVLKLEELSSGEQQIVTLCAAIVTSRASVISVTEPELSLSANSQRLLKSILEEQVAQGLFDQLILESHVQVFDGPEVVRFQRNNGVTQVSRESRLPEAGLIDERARSAGAEREFVTAEGYTRLPESMRRELGVEGGGMVWFLKDDRKRWAAWKTEELDRLFGLGSDSPSAS